jgi:hypothetical protein
VTLTDFARIFGPLMAARAERMIDFIESRAAKEPTRMEARGGPVELQTGQAVVTTYELAEAAACSFSTAHWITRLVIAAGLVEQGRASRRSYQAILRVSNGAHRAGQPEAA